MNEQVSNLRQVLAQTQAVEKSQENARRRGEVEQQLRGRQIVDQVDIHSRQVEETPEAREKRVDPEGQGEGGRKRRRRREDGEPESDEAAAETEEDAKGRRIDRTA